MKDLFQAADDLYNASLKVVHTITKMGLDKARPETREVLPKLCEAMEEYERSRFGRRKVVIEFEAPMPTVSSLVRRREMAKGKGRKIPGAIKLSENDTEQHSPRRKKRDGEKTST